MKIAIDKSGNQVKFAQKHSPYVSIIRWFGNILILISIAGFTFTFWPLLSVEIPYRINKWRGKVYTVDSKPANFGDILATDLVVPKNLGFGIVVEKINANALVVSDVDWTNERVYNQELKKGVGHAKDTVKPGQTGLSFMFAHSVLNPWDAPRYNAVFYLLREVEAGDRIVTFYEGKRYDYYVTEKRVVGPRDVGFMSQKYDKPTLVLQTCDPPGTTWKRLLVFAQMREN